jgi:hypothetical protein
MDSGPRTWVNEIIRERLEAVEKDLLGPLVLRFLIIASQTAALWLIVCITQKN